MDDKTIIREWLSARIVMRAVGSNSRLIEVYNWKKQPDIILNARLFVNDVKKAEKVFEQLSTFLDEFPEAPPENIRMESPVTYNAEFLKTCRTLDRQGDKRYCVPLAFSLVSGKCAGFVNDFMIATGQRKIGKGVPPSVWRQTLIDLGIKTTDVTAKYRPYGATVRTLSRVLDPNRKFLVLVRRHILAVVYGEVMDWTAERCFRVEEIMEVEENGIAVSDYQPKGKRKKEPGPVFIKYFG